MANGYAAEEAPGFCTEYLNLHRHIKRHVWETTEEEGTRGCVVEGRVVCMCCLYRMSLGHTIMSSDTIPGLGRCAGRYKFILDFEVRMLSSNVADRKDDYEGHV